MIAGLTAHLTALLPRRISSAVFYAAILLVLLGASNAFAQNAALGATAYGSTGFNCQSCHGSLPAGALNGIQNAADQPAVIDYSIAHNLGSVMGGFSGVSAADRANIAAYIGQQFRNPIGVVVGFNAPATAIRLGSSISLTAGTFTSIAQVGARGHGTVTFSGTTAFYTPDTNYCCTDSFKYQASGPGGVSSERIVNISIPLPAPPRITTTPFANSTAFDTSITFRLPVTGFFTSITLAPTGGIGGTLSQPRGNADTTITYKPPSNNFGAASFTYTVTYATGTGTSATLNGTVNITVGLPPAPATPNLTVTVPFNSTSFDIVLPITGGFQNVIVVPAAAGGIGGLLTQPAGNTSTTVRYQPPANQSGMNAASFTYTATAFGGQSSSGTVSITVSPPSAPVTPNISVTVPFNSPGFDIVLPVTGGFQNTIAVPATATGGGAVTQPNGTASTTVTYKPNSGQSGPASFTYTATTGGSTGVSSTGTVSITVSPPPVATAPDISVTVPFNSPGFDIVLPVTGGFQNVIAVPATAGGIGGPITQPGGNTSTTVRYQPPAGQSGVNAASFTYTATTLGGSGQPARGTVTVTISPPGAPVTPNVSVTVPFNSPGVDIVLPVTGGFQNTIAVPATATGGGGVTQPNGAASTTVTYKPGANQFGPASFTYTATTGGNTGVSSTGTVSITVSPPGPAAAPPLSVTVPFNSTGFDIVLPITGGFQNVIAVPATASGIGGTLNQPSGNASTTVRYTPPAGQFGVNAASFTYTTTTLSGSGVVTTGIVTISVVAPPAPTTANLSINVPFNSPGFDIVLPVTGGFQNTIAVPSTATGIGGTITQPNGTGSTTVRYQPPPGQAGSNAASFTYTATSQGGNSATGVITISIALVAPTAGAATLTVPLNTPTTLDLQPFITGSLIAGITVAATPTHGSVTVSGTQVTFTPANNYFGPDTFTYFVFGNGVQSQPALVTVNVVGRPDPSQDPEVIGLIAAQVEAARRFSRTQLSNYQWRLELLHRTHAGGPDAAGGGNLPAVAPSGKAFNGVSSPRGDYAASDQKSDARIARMFGATAGGNGLPGLMQKTSLPAANLPGEQNAPTLPGIIESVINVAQTRSINVANAGLLGDVPSADANGVGVWTGGDFVFGKRGALGRQGNLDFHTSGVTIAADRRFTDTFVAGFGLGYGHDKTDVGSNGTQLRARDLSLAFYGTYQPRPQVFIDAVLGWGKLYLHTDRFVAPINEFAHAKRRGEQVFGSLTAGYDYRRNQFLLSPYARLDHSIDRLGYVNETGAGSYALTYFGETIPSGDLALGLRGESTHVMNFGLALPRFRVEYLRDLGSNRQAQVAYADLVAQRYTLVPETVSRNSLLLALGSDFLFRNGVTFGVDYEYQRGSKKERNQAIRLRLAKELDGRR